jgi:hypothetical protein
MQGFRSYSTSSLQTLEESAATEKHHRNKASLRIKPSSPAGANNPTLLNNLSNLQLESVYQAWPRHKHI